MSKKKSGWLQKASQRMKEKGTVGKFTATKKKTGKSTEELMHSKNPLTRKRAVFAANMKKIAAARKKSK